MITRCGQCWAEGKHCALGAQEAPARLVQGGVGLAVRKGFLGEVRELLWEDKTCPRSPKAGGRGDVTNLGSSTISISDVD